MDANEKKRDDTMTVPVTFRLPVRGQTGTGADNCSLGFEVHADGLTKITVSLDSTPKPSDAALLAPTALLIKALRILEQSS